MKIALCSSFVPFIYGGARNIVEWLEAMLLEAGHTVEHIYLPHVDHPDMLFQQMVAYQWIDLSAADRIICFRPPAHHIHHPHKILWFIHHIRSFYDLWDTTHRGFPDDLKHRAIRDSLIKADTAALKGAKKIYTNSQVVSDRLRRYNDIDSEVLYPPIFQADRFFCKGFNDEIVYICRMEDHKRQHLLIKAMQYTRTQVRLRLCGTGSNPDYPARLKELVAQSGLQDKVAIENGWISENRKIDLLANCLAAAYLPVDEDSYGYPSLEASHASKPVLTTTDSGGVMELVVDRFNGLAVHPDPQSLALAMDELYLDKQTTQAMGKNAKEKISMLNINWHHVIEKVLA